MAKRINPFDKSMKALDDIAKALAGDAKTKTVAAATHAALREVQSFVEGLERRLIAIEGKLKK